MRVALAVQNIGLVMSVPVCAQAPLPSFEQTIVHRAGVSAKQRKLARLCASLIRAGHGHHRACRATCYVRMSIYSCVYRTGLSMALALLA